VIDLHSHILPDLDDGARTLAESLDIARACVADGVEVIAATPHVRHDYPTTADMMEEQVSLLQRSLDDEGVELAVLAGGEISFDYLGRLTADDKRRFGLGGNPSYLLLEFPYYGWTLALEHHVKALVADGITPVVAHPERNADVQADPQRVMTLVESGALIQLTAAAVDGRIGRSAQAASFELIELGLVHLIGSDAHHPGIREAGMSAAVRAVADPVLTRWLTVAVPGAIVRNAKLPPHPAATDHAESPKPVPRPRYP
jgi:protein-tyrosine phosphatase